MSIKNIVLPDYNITQADRKKLFKQRPCIIWLTGLSASGKSSIANEVEQQLYERGHITYLLDGDILRHGLNIDLGFNKRDRIENIRRVGEVSKLFLDAGLIVLTAFISPFREGRNIARDLVKKGDFIEVYVDSPIDVCEERDPKGLYKKSRGLQIKDFTGIDSPYEAPESPEIHTYGYNQSVKQSSQSIIRFLEINNYILMEH